MYGNWRCMDESCKWPEGSWLALLVVAILVALLLAPRRRNKPEPPPRYKVIEGSESNHCCFSYTVWDTHRDENIAECFTEEDADAICDSLNHCR